MDHSVEKKVVVAKITINKMKYGWSKYGGGRYGLVQSKADDWVCQACGDTQHKELPSFMIPFGVSLREFMRICSSCQNIKQNNGLTEIRELISLVRKKRGL